eukprot:5331128-Pyramimonas_sp.AAC.1
MHSTALEPRGRLAARTPFGTQRQARIRGRVRGACPAAAVAAGGPGGPPRQGAPMGPGEEAS